MSGRPSAARLPLLGHAGFTSTVACRQGRSVDVAAFLGDVARTAHMLPQARWIFNLCNDRYRFSVGLAAALVRGQATLLPPDTAMEMLRAVAADHGCTSALVDRPLGLQAVREIEVVHDASERALDMPVIPADQVAVVAFTSGSTGRPRAQMKSWGSLVQTAREEAIGLGLVEEPSIAVVGTVPSQHMYGLESSVILALCNGWAIHPGRPLFPADVGDALAQVPPQRILVTTPVHLRALLRDRIDFPPLRLIVCATAPLSRELAHDAERAFSAPLQEVYGFTEAGAVATRRTATGDVWNVLPGIELRQEGKRTIFSGGHIQTDSSPTDMLEMIDHTRFRLHGRDADMVNVAGKRSSIAYLDHQLQSISGVEDGAFFLPDEGDAAVTRPAAFAVAPSLGRQGLLDALRERLDPVFLPRPLYLVLRLPRSASGKLPREALLALLTQCRDRSAEEGNEARAQLAAADSAVALGHFPSDPIIPGAMIIDHVLRAAEQRFALPASAWDVTSAKFLHPARPGEVMRMRFQRELRRVEFECEVAGRVVASGVLHIIVQQV